MIKVKYFLILLLFSILFSQCNKHEEEEDFMINSGQYGGRYIGGAIIVKNADANSFEGEIITCRSIFSMSNNQRDWMSYSVNDNDYNAELTESINFTDYTLKKYIGKNTLPGYGSYKFSCHLIQFKNSFFINCNDMKESEIFLESTVIVNPEYPNMCAEPTDSIFNIEVKRGTVLDYDLEFNDPEGDSLAYNLIPASDNFYLPEQPPFVTNDGYLYWNNPAVAGKFSYRIIVEEWRSGVKLASSSYLIIVDVKE